MEMTEGQIAKRRAFNKLVEVIRHAEDVTNDPDFMYYFDGQKRARLLADLVRAMEGFGKACDLRTEEMFRECPTPPPQSPDASDSTRTP